MSARRARRGRRTGGAQGTTAAMEARKAPSKAKDRGMDDRVAEVKRRQTAWLAQRQAATEIAAARDELAGKTPPRPQRRAGSAGPVETHKHAPRASPRHLSSSHSMDSSQVPPTGGGAGGSDGGVYPDQVLNKVTERLTMRLRSELSDELRREITLEAEKKAELAGKLESYLDTELQTHQCPVCYELMQPPMREPILLFPCGHTFCKLCIDAHLSRSSTCPFCRAAVESRAVNHSLKNLIDTFAAKRTQINKGQIPGFSVAPGGAPAAAGGYGMRPSGLAAAGAGVMRPPTGPGSGGGFAPMPRYATPDTAPSVGGPGPNPQDMDAALKYLHEYRNYKMRRTIVSNELADCRKTAEKSVAEAQKTKQAIRLLDDDAAALQDKLHKIQEELNVVRKHRETQEAKLAENEESRLEATRRAELVGSTLDSLERDMEKARLMVENFAPHLLAEEDGTAPTGAVTTAAPSGSVAVSGSTAAAAAAAAAHAAAQQQYMATAATPGYGMPATPFAVSAPMPVSAPAAPAYPGYGGDYGAAVFAEQQRLAAWNAYYASGGAPPPAASAPLPGATSHWHGGQ